MDPGSLDFYECHRRQFILALGAIFSEACHSLSQTQSATPRTASTSSSAAPKTLPRDAWQPVFRSLITTVLPFEHPAFPKVSADALMAQAQQLFQLDKNKDFATFPQALLLFDDTALFENPFDPIVDDQRRDLALSRVRQADIPQAIDDALALDREAWRHYVARFGGARFVEQTFEARKAYLSLWAQSAFITRRRFYRGAKTLVTVSAYSMQPFWDVIGYEGPLLQHG